MDVKKSGYFLRYQNGGFTLLELLIVVGILAIVGAGVITAYDGLDKKAAKGKATYEIGALDSTMRVYRSINGAFPDTFDSMGVDDDGTGADAVARLNSLNDSLRGKIGVLTLTADMVASLGEAGITELRYIDGSAYDNTAFSAGGGSVGIPNRVFDNPTRGEGYSVALAAGVQVMAIESTGAGGSIDGEGGAPADSERLRDIAGLDETLLHAVVAVGIGNNSSLIKPDSDFAGGLSEAPTYPDVAQDQYSRYIALFHVATDDDADGAFAAAETFGRARFLGVLDTKGDWLDEEFAEFTGQKD